MLLCVSHLQSYELYYHILHINNLQLSEYNLFCESVGLWEPSIIMFSAVQFDIIFYYLL